MCLAIYYTKRNPLDGSSFLLEVQVFTYSGSQNFLVELYGGFIKTIFIFLSLIYSPLLNIEAWITFELPYP